ncbi:MAG: 2Fe-2S iron-sulfur cluster-binding protein, partial [Acutalibacteraceae bacterium]|nr:2Fe-2S iron-sulfur cluster-binding protein [Acutalibacteraceae bacterium]
MINVKINGIEISAEKGQTILQIAEANGIEIPTLCY